MAFLMTDDQRRLIVKCGESANHRWIVRDEAIPIKFTEIAEKQ
jgi:hypothetical protein